MIILGSRKPDEAKTTTYKFACQILFMKNKGTMKDIQKYFFMKGEIVSNALDVLERGADIERDIFKPIVDETNFAESLENGVWLMYVQGDAVSNRIKVDLTEQFEEEWFFEEKEVLFTSMLDLTVKK